MSARKGILQIEQNIGSILIGCENVTRHLITALLAGGHVLLEDLPGTGKTTLARTLAASVSGSFRRIQFTPDLLPADVTGLSVYSPKEGTFSFRPGPVFTNVLLADEINRATPRTQSGLLECMEERQVTSDGVTRSLEDFFFVIATQNPIESSGTFPLPEAQLDRFMMRLSIGLPDQEAEAEILSRYLSQDSGEALAQISAVSSKEEVLLAREEVKKVVIAPELLDYIARIAAASRNRADVAAGVSPRGSLALLHAAQARAFMDERGYIVPEDIKALAGPVLAHRLVLTSRTGVSQAQNSVIAEILSSMPVPTEKAFERSREKRSLLRGR